MSREKYHKIEISFKGLDLDSYRPDSKKLPESFEAKLYIMDTHVKLDVFCDEACDLDAKFNLWFREVNNMNAGSYISFVSTNVQRLNRIDFSNYSIIGSRGTILRHTDSIQTLTLLLDGAKFYWHSHNIATNCAYFGLDDNGFNLVSEYYSTFDDDDVEENTFHLKKYRGTNLDYPLNNIRFKPEFLIDYEDKKSNREIKLDKIPVFKLTFDSDATEDEIRSLAEDIKLIASFYLHKNIEFEYSRIYFNDIEIFERIFNDKSISNHASGLSYWGVNIDFHKFMCLNWQSNFIENKKLLTTIIPLFNQSILVDEQSRLLIRYSILETSISFYSNKFKNNPKKKFTFEKNKKAIWKEAFLKLQSAVVETEKKDFKKRWDDIQALLANKPMITELDNFIKYLNIDISNFPISIKDIRKMRNDLSHGSIEKYNEMKLTQANILLFGIIGVIILKAFGIENLDLKNIVDKAKTIC